MVEYESGITNYNYKSMIKYRQLDESVIVSYLVVQDGNIAIERYKNNELMGEYLLGTIDELDERCENFKQEDVYEEYRKRLLDSKVSILRLEIFETFVGTGFIDNTLDLVEALQYNTDEEIIQELKEIRESICNNLESRYTEIEKIGYMNIADGYILRLQEESRIIKEKR